MRIPSDDRRISHLVICAPDSQISRFVFGSLYFFPSQRDVVNYHIPLGGKTQIVCVCERWSSLTASEQTERQCSDREHERSRGKPLQSVCCRPRDNPAEEGPRNVVAVVVVVFFSSAVKATTAKCGSAIQTQDLGTLR